LFQTRDNMLGSAEVAGATRKLRDSKEIIPYIYSIYVYNRSCRKVYCVIENSGINIEDSADFFDAEILDIIQGSPVRRFLAPRPIPVMNRITGQSEGAAPSYSYYISTVTAASDEVDNAVVINIREAWLREVISAMDPGSPVETLVIDSQGRVVSNDAMKGFLDDLSAEPYIQRILNDESPSGYFTDTAEGSKINVAYVGVNNNQWRFIRIYPYVSDMEKIGGIMNSVLAIMLLALVLGLITAAIIFWRIRLPIGRLFLSNARLSRFERSHFFSARQKVMMRLLTDTAPLNMDTLRAELMEYDVKLCID